MGVEVAKFESAGQVTEHFIPGVYSRRNTIGGSLGVSSGNLVILGTSMGGKPLTLHSVADKAEAKELLQSGDLLNGVVHAFNGSNTFVPQQVFCMRVNNGTRSYRELKNGATPVLKVYSWDYGVHTNQIKMWLKAGTVEGKKIVVSYKSDLLEIDNISRPSFSIRYTGTGNSPTCEITATGLNLKANASTEGEGLAEEIDKFSVTWEEQETLESLVAKINDTGVYAATLLDTAANVSTRELDHCASVSIAGSVATVFKSDLQALINALKSIQFIGDVELLTPTNRIVPEDDTGYLYFTGAINGTTSVSDWAEALELLEKEDIQIIATPSTDTDVHVLIADHCISMSTVAKKKERTFWVGMSSSTTIEQGIEAAKSLNTELGSLVITGANASNPLTGKSEDISPALLACKCAGMEAAIAVSTPLTNKVMKVNSFSKKYKDSEMDTMIKNGIVPFGINENGELVCIRSMTTYQGNSLIQNERSMIRAVLFMDRDLRKAYSRRTGSNSAPSSSDILQVLENKAKSWYSNNLITMGDDGKLVFNAKVRFDGDKAYVTFERFIRSPNNFTFITGTNKIYSSTVEV